MIAGGVLGVLLKIGFWVLVSKTQDIELNLPRSSERMRMSKSPLVWGVKYNNLIVPRRVREHGLVSSEMQSTHPKPRTYMDSLSQSD